MRNHNRLTIRGDRVSFFEDGGIASDIRGNATALAVTYPFETPAGASENRVAYLARETDDRIRVRQGETSDSLTYVRCESSRSGSGEVTSVPERFRGLYAPDRKACEEDYNSTPAFQHVTVNARDVSFFETGGPITDINVDGDAIAITLEETVGENTATRAIYLALTGEDTASYRADDGEPIQRYVRCG